ncbi:MAG: 5'-nucleotidase C-terminal domain-containing protein, partial [Acidimicrobiales bacterium]
IVMITGDFNTFEWTNDLTEILPGEDGVLNNLMTASALNSQDRKNRYTFIFEGNSQALDHFFVTDNLVNSRTELDIVHVNVDRTRLTGDVTASDHEPLLARFRLPKRDTPLIPPERFNLQVLHASDLEGGVEALDRATNFAAIVDALEDDESADASLTLSAGDNYIPGPFFAASSDGSMRPVFQSVYSDLFGAELTNVREGGGRADISIMNVIGFDASALGNHEFDAGTDAVASIIAPDVRGTTLNDIRWPGAQFPYLSSNLDFSADGNLSGLFTSDLLPNTDFAAGPAELLAGANPPKIAPATVIDVGDGEKVGVVGATTQLLDIISSPGSTTVIGPNANDMAQVATLIQPQIDAMEAMGINKIVIVSHFQQLALERELSSILDGADIMIAGGSDSLLANDDDALRVGDSADETYPVLSTDAAGDPVAIVSTDGEYSYVGQLNVVFNAVGQLVAPDGTLVDSLDDLDLSRNGPVKTEDAEVVALWGSTDAAVAEGTKANLVKRLVDAVEAVVIAKDGNVVGETAVYLDGRRESVRTEETNFGNLSADANLAVAQAADDNVVFSLKNGGGIRAPIGEIDIDGNFLPPQANPLSGKLEGQISQLDIENSLRFNNGLSLVSLTGTEMQAMIEHAVAATGPGNTPGQFPQIGGGEFSYDPTADVGSRVIDFSVLDSTGTTLEPVIVNGAVVSPTKVYRIVTLNFLAGGGDGYPFDELSAANRVDLVGTLSDVGDFDFADPGSEQDALAEFLDDNHTIGGTTPFDEPETEPALDTRIVDITNR